MPCACWSRRESNTMRSNTTAWAEIYRGRKAARIGMPAGRVCKTPVTCTDRREYFVFVIPVGNALDLKAAAPAAGVKALAMLPLAKLFPLTGYFHGGCSPIGLKTAMRVFVDSSVEDFPKMYLSGGRIGLNLGVAPLGI